MDDDIIQTGTSVMVVEVHPQEWGWDRESRQQEIGLLQRYLGKVGEVWHIDGCEEMPFLVRFDSCFKVPFSEFRFRMDELEKV